jgi:O-antigen/teichoic acid export membrane protein/SAM-dependent methyltransferase
MRVLKNAFWLTGGRVTADLASFGLFTVISRAFGPHGTGVYSYAFAVGNLIGIIGGAGFEEFGIREYACAAPQERARLWRALTAAQFRRLAVGIAFLALYLLSGIDRSGQPALVIELSMFFLGWYVSRLLFAPAMALEFMALPALADVVCRTSAIAIAIALLLAGVSALPIAILGFPIAGLAIAYLGLRSSLAHAGVPRFTAPWSGISAALRGSTPFTLTELLSLFYVRADVLLIAYWLGAAQTGLYAMQVKFVEVGLLPVLLLGTAVYPLFGRLAAEAASSPRLERAARDYTDAVFCLSGWLAVGIACLLPLVIVPLFGEQFRASISLLPWFSLLTVAKGIDAAASRLLFSVRRQAFYVRTLSCMTVLMVLLNCLLIPLFGLRGAVWAALASSLLGNIGCICGLREHVRPWIFVRAGLRLVGTLVLTGCAIGAAQRLGAGPGVVAVGAVLLFPLLAFLAGLVPDWRHGPLLENSSSTLASAAAAASSRSSPVRHRSASGILEDPAGCAHEACRKEWLAARSLRHNDILRRPGTSGKMSYQLLSYREMNAALESRINSLSPPVRILEAGCGRSWGLKLSVPYTVTGVDLDRHALDARSDLHRAVVGDLRTVLFPARSFDVIYCAFVLEHVKGAEQVLERFLRWLAPGGILAVEVPDRDSAYGFLTRITPFWVHVLAYRWLFGYREAGSRGHGPYPTHHEEVVSERGLLRFCEKHRLAGPQLYRQCSYGGYRIVLAGAFVASILSAGRLAWRHNNLLMIAVRPVEAVGRGDSTSAGPDAVRRGVVPAG